MIARLALEEGLEIRATGYLIRLFRNYRLLLESGALDRGESVRVIEHELRPVPITQRMGLPSLWFVAHGSSDPIRRKDPEGQITEYRDTPDTVAMRERITSWNSFLSENYHADLCLPDQTIETLHDNDKNDPEAILMSLWERDRVEQKVVQFDRKHLYRVFNNSSWDQGGRFYGGWWQEVPSEARKYITINAGPTREFDYSNLHAAMVYASEGLALTEDAYSLPRVDRKYRKLIKKSFFRLLNANEGQRIQQPPEALLPPGMSWEQLLAAIKEKHAPIAKHLHSGAGLRFQRIDADIAEDVMLSMMRQDKLALPVHDSFIVATGSGNLVKGEMVRAYRQRMRAEIQIDADVTFLDHELGEERQAYDFSAEEEIEFRSNEEGYEGYRARLSDFLRSRTVEWVERFDPNHRLA